MAKPVMFRARVSHGGKRIRVDVAVPILVGVTRAAELLGVPKSNISRLRDQGRMPEPVPQEGPGAPMWVKAQVLELAEKLAAERAERAHPVARVQPAQPREPAAA